MRLPSRTAASTLALLALALGAAACSESKESLGASKAFVQSTDNYGPAATGAHNDQDVSFLTGMIPHHGQAVQMSAMVFARDTPAVLGALASVIRDGQTKELNQMAGWLQGWDEEVPIALSTEHMGHQEHGEGMLTAAELETLDKSQGTEFNRLFLVGMIKHHEGAVMSAQAEVATGSNPEVIALAKQIIKVQDREIAAMKAQLADLD